MFLLTQYQGLKVEGLYHDIDLKDTQQDFSTPFKPLPPVEPTTHMLLEVSEDFIAPDIEKLAQTYDTLPNLPTLQTNDDVRLSLENASPRDIPQLEQNLMSLPELTPEKE